MLAILDSADVPRWLGVEEDPRDLLRPYPSELLKVSLAKAPARGGQRSQGAGEKLL